jgi:hypothetical protein
MRFTVAKHTGARATIPVVIARHGNTANATVEREVAGDAIVSTVLTCAAILRSPVFVVIAHPILRGIRIFVTAFGGKIEEIVGGIHQVNATFVRGVAVVKIALFVAVKCAHTLLLIDFHSVLSVIVRKDSAFDLLGRERDMEIKIEIAVE